jgi:hypothetical protein
MRKVNILAMATTVLAVVTVVTGLIRGDVSTSSGKMSAATAAQHVLTTGRLNAQRFDAI